ncbi:peptide/nickel transport system permease protein [Rhizobium skierniewicense]|uniref:Peptide/nickel transport system permease protein n=1 Tax=Rhizobium skierniewicense TaxID=984260 RepID=A0A7W6G5E8_9HYPH|nr:ABC transporter permease [Rhizobium skierniewicense]MBB3948471.1 peptide/nickel transport system permease protein [Rhizobium skierniewicense]
MLAQSAAKVFQTGVVLLIVSVASFSLLKLAPGDPVVLMLGSEFSQESYDSLQRELGLDRPVVLQYLTWLGNFITGDWGTSFVSRTDIFTFVVKEALPVTLTLTACSMLLAIAVGIPLGVIAAVRKDTIWDTAIAVFALTGSAFPSFFLGIVLIWFLAVQFGIFPVMGFVAPWEDFWGGLYHMTLPALTLSTYFIGMIVRVTRSSLIDVMEQPFIAAAKARGEPRWRVIWVHGVRNIAMPVVTMIGLQLGGILQGAVLTETVFSLPGLGQMLTDAVLGREYTLVQAGVMLTATMFILINLLIDLSYPLLDPRLRQR